MKEYMFLDSQKEIKKSRKPYYFNIDKNVAKELKIRQGDYWTIKYKMESLYKDSDKILKETKKIIKNVLKPYKKILVVGLGNKNIIADSFGIKVCDKLIATNHYNDFLMIPKVAIWTPNVVTNTGISSFKVIKMLVKDLKPDVILIIDSMLTKNAKHLNSAIEINTAGIISGASICHSKEITKETFGIPIVAILTPLILELNEELYTSPYINDILEQTSNIVSEAINTIIMT